MYQLFHKSPYGCYAFGVYLLHNPAGICKPVLHLHKSEWLRKFADPCFGLVYGDPIGRRPLRDFGKHFFQKIVAFVNDIAIVVIPAVILNAPDNFYIIVNRDLVYDTGILRDLIPDIQVLGHILIAGQQSFVDFVMLQRIKHDIHTVGVFFVCHIRNIDPRLSQHFGQEIQGRLVAGHGLYLPKVFGVSDVIVIFRIVNQQNKTIV